MTRLEFEKRVREACGGLPDHEAIIECHCGRDKCVGWQITRKGLTEPEARLITGGCAANRNPLKTFGKSIIQL